MSTTNLTTSMFLAFLVSWLPSATTGAEPWSIRFIEPSSANLFKPIITSSGIRIESLGANSSQRKDHPEYVSLHYRLSGAITALSFDYAQTGDASQMPVQLLDVTGRELWRYEGQGDAPQRVELSNLTTRGLLVFRVSRSRGAKLLKGWSHSISNVSVTKDVTAPVTDADGFIVLDDLDELRGYASADKSMIRMKPGVYELDTAFFRHFIEFSGNDNHWDLTGVTISASLDLFRQFGRDQGTDGFYCVIDVTGDRNVLEGLTVKNHGEGYGLSSRNKLFNITGSDCLVSNVTALTSGSNPWGYGSLFGIAGGVVRKMNGIRIGQPARNTRLIGSRVHMRAMGHAIFVQGAIDTLIEDCHVDGLLRPTDEILAESSGYAFEQGFRVPGYGEGVQIGPDRLIPAGEIVSLSEDGIRMYPGSEGVDSGASIIRNCTVTNMRRGICTGLSAASDKVIHCEVRNCIAAGFNIGSGDTLVGCAADAKYAEALCVPYLSSEGARVELELLDSREGMANNLVAKINGRKHDITLRTSEPAFVPRDMAIELASKNGYGSFQKGKRSARGITLNNQTSARVLLFPDAIGNTIISQGPVSDQGEADNTIQLGR
ncbi:hypothetical protein Q31b_47590 [Novipirellula aureliae]|uniref:Right handed beta helix domain-containing protein n=1 Tax=Novipirellula aureliae TaxID=2527966 RepID=A0A5C6DIE7_9BACT|nr:hypothetical protein [Novipirellula aureliae]TWU36478.1 hypothetical protein Q31b_47590 [Novipirellula aureliae]